MTKNLKKSINTKFGKAILGSDGYYRIKDRSTGNFDKLLHRLIYEEYHGDIIDGYIIHHIDGNSVNNNPDNLVMMSRENHNKIHHIGKKLSYETKRKIGNANNGKKRTPEQIEINRLARLGKKLSEEHKLNISIPNNTTGYFRVSKCNNKNYKQGFYWCYSYYDDNNKPKRITSINLDTLRNKVLQRNLPWVILDEKIAKSTEVSAVS